MAGGEFLYTQERGNDVKITRTMIPAKRYTKNDQKGYSHRFHGTHFQRFVWKPLHQTNIRDTVYSHLSGLVELTLGVWKKIS